VYINSVSVSEIGEVSLSTTQHLSDLTVNMRNLTQTPMRTHTSPFNSASSRAPHHRVA
jgi:hypothetical protein